MSFNTKTFSIGLDRIFEYASEQHFTREIHSLKLNNYSMEQLLMPYMFVII